MQPLLLGSNVRDDNTLLTVDLTNPDVYVEDHLALPKDTLHVVRTIFLWRDTAYQRLAIHNHGDRPVDLRLTMLFDSDFADLFEVRGLRRKRRGLLGRHVTRPATTVLSYRGLDASLRQTLLNFDPPPSELTATTASYRLDLAPQEAQPIFITVGCGAPGAAEARCLSCVPCARSIAIDAPYRTTPPPSRRRTTSSMRCFAARWPISTC